VPEVRWRRGVPSCALLAVVLAAVLAALLAVPGPAVAGAARPAAALPASPREILPNGDAPRPAASPADRITWSNVTPSPSPTGRYSAAIAYDASAHELVLFGGAVPGASGPAADTWGYALGSWRELCSGGSSFPSCPVEPPASVRGAMAYDPGREGLVYYDWGLGLTFVYSNGSWTNLSGGPHPEPQSIPSEIAYDPAFRAVVAFDASGSLWEFTRGNWSLVHLIGGAPPARLGAQLYYDPATGSLVLFGGVTGDTAWDDMWALANDSWTELPAKLPPVDLLASGYDAGYGYEALLGAAGGSLELWAYAQASWHLLPTTPGLPPPPALAPAFSYDGTDGTLVLFSGLLSAPSGAYAPATTYAPVDGLVSVNLTLSRTAAVAGDTFRLFPEAKGGVLPYSYTYVQLVPGCAGVNLPSIACEARTVGTYPLSVLIGDGRWGAVKVSANITVVPIPSASIAATPNPTTVGVPVELVATIAGGLAPFDYAWQFGDGGAGVGATVNHTFATAGTFNVTLTARNGTGVPTVAELLVFADPPPRITGFSASPNVTDVHVLVQFAGAATGGTAPLAYNWTFGDGFGRAIGPVANYSYAEPGRYTVDMWANDSLGAYAFATQVEQINPAPNVLILATPAPYNTSVQFGVGLSGGTAPFQFVWQLGDGSVAVEPALTHTYAAPGFYTVTVTVRDASGWTSVDALNVSVHPSAPPETEIPWYETGTGLNVLGLLLLGVGGGSLIVLARRFRRREPPGPDPEPGPIEEEASPAGPEALPDGGAEAPEGDAGPQIEGPALL
jgi:PKD repeat protein